MKDLQFWKNKLIKNHFIKDLTGKSFELIHEKQNRRYRIWVEQDKSGSDIFITRQIDENKNCIGKRMLLVDVVEVQAKGNMWFSFNNTINAVCY